MTMRYAHLAPELSPRKFQRKVQRKSVPSQRVLQNLS